MGIFRGDFSYDDSAWRQISGEIQETLQIVLNYYLHPMCFLGGNAKGK